MQGDLSIMSGKFTDHHVPIYDPMRSHLFAQLRALKPLTTLLYSLPIRYALELEFLFPLLQPDVSIKQSSRKPWVIRFSETVTP